MPWPCGSDAVAPLLLTLERRLSESALELRSASFPGPPDRGDAFDERSVHVFVRHGDGIAAYGRLTFDGVFRTWSRGAACLPHGPTVADLGRCCVAPTYRGLSLFRLVCLEALGHATALGLSSVNGACVPGRGPMPALRELGFEASGPTIELLEPNGNRATVQPLVCDLGAAAARWEGQRGACVAHLRARGYDLGTGQR